jgi:hypothetical protein
VRVYPGEMTVQMSDHDFSMFCSRIGADPEKLPDAVLEDPSHPTTLDDVELTAADLAEFGFVRA